MMPLSFYVKSDSDFLNSVMWIPEKSRDEGVVFAMAGVVGRAAGQSTGGTMALVAATTQDCFAGAISLAPFCSLPRILEDNPDARSVLESRFGPLQEKHFRTANALEIVKGLKKPTLIVQGTADESVPFSHGKLLYEQLPNVAQFRPVQDGNHHLTNVDRPPVLADIVGWLEKQR